MKLKFKVQPYQTNVVESVVDCFAGQVNTSGIVPTGLTRASRETSGAIYKPPCWKIRASRIPISS